MKYPKYNDGEGIKFNASEEVLALACCDCGLVHLAKITKLGKGMVGIAFKRDKRATAQLRRYGYGNLQKPNSKKYRLIRGSSNAPPVKE